jgi:hypothetical protein
MPITEGVSASLFEATCNCYPIVSNIAETKVGLPIAKNGQLIPVDDSTILAEEILWTHREQYL